MTRDARREKDRTYIRVRKGKRKRSRGMDVDEEETGSRKYTRSTKKGQYRLLKKKRREMT